MKKLFIGSGILLVLLVIMAFTDHKDSKNAAFNEGNKQYAAGNFEQAVKLYDEAPDKLDKYLNSGNASFKLGEAAQDPKQKLPLYQQAIKTYQQGILKFPENVALKYNYEYVLKKIEPQQQDQQDSNKNDDKKDDQDKQNGKNQEDQKGEDQKGDEQKDQQGEQSDKQDGQQPSPSAQPGGQDGQQPSPSAQPEKDGQQSSQGEQSSPGPGESSPSPGGESASQSGLSDKELEQVMGMLEKQEEDSLKNNQEIKNEDKGEAYDW